MAREKKVSDKTKRVIRVFVHGIWVNMQDVRSTSKQLFSFLARRGWHVQLRPWNGRPDELPTDELVMVRLDEHSRESWHCLAHAAHERGHFVYCCDQCIFPDGTSTTEGLAEAIKAFLTKRKERQRQSFTFEEFCEQIARVPHRMIGTRDLTAKSGTRLYIAFEASLERPTKQKRFEQIVIRLDQCDENGDSWRVFILSQRGQHRDLISQEQIGEDACALLNHALSRIR